MFQCFCVSNSFKFFACQAQIVCLFHMFLNLIPLALKCQYITIRMTVFFPKKIRLQAVTFNNTVCTLNLKM